ncbi:MAG: hypothetical protein HY587_08545 [Candidatus Omnitrophica bacterium]|nr:hypothetical protein [Candidatus Omnitrophota bacterium]
MEMGRVLKKEGRIILLDWCRDYPLCRLCDLFLKFLDPAHKQCYTQAQLRYFLEQAGFSVLSDLKLRLHVIWGTMIAEAIK